MPGPPLVFVNYRSVDEPAAAFALYRELAERFGVDSVFRDADSLPLGRDFQPPLLDFVRRCAVLLVVIGENWFTGDRIHDPDDWVRREITEALEHGVRVVPVLVGKRRRLAVADLPEPIKPIASHQYFTLRDREMGRDIVNLIDALIRVEPRLQEQDRRGAQGHHDVQGHHNVQGHHDGGNRQNGAAGLTRVAATARSADPLDSAARLLAAQVFAQACDAVQAWQLDERHVVTHWRFDAEGATRTWSSRTEHSVAELAGWTRDLRRGRLALLGEGGSGKTSLAVMLIRELARGHVDGAKVPVLVPLTGWNPDTDSFHAWLATRLAKDYPALRAQQFGTAAAEALVRGRHVLPVLDGFDELPPDAQRAATRALSRLSNDDAWIITCRTDTFDALPALFRTAVDATLTAQPLTAAEVGDHLRRMVGDDPAWHPVLADLDGPVLADLDGSPLGQALRTPLTLWLVGQTYVETGADPTPLRAFTDPEQIRHHLLALLVPSLITARAPGPHPSPFLPLRRWPVDQATRWLSTLAGYISVRGTTELSWWTLTGLGPRHPRLVLCVLLVIVAALPLGAVFLAAGKSGNLAQFGLLVASFAVAGSLCSTARSVPGFASFRLAGRTFPLIRSLSVGVLAGLLVAGALLLLSTLASWSVPGEVVPLAPTLAAAAGVGFGVGMGLLQWVMVVTPLEVARTPAVVLRADRTLTLTYAGVFAACGTAVLVHAIGPAGLGALPAWAVLAMFARWRLGQDSARVRGNAWAVYVLTVGWGAAAGRLPRPLMPFLADMHRLGILRQVGAVYQFRHRDLQAILAQPPHPHPASATTFTANQTHSGST